MSSNSKLIRIRVEIEGFFYFAMVDTGASDSLISENIVNKLNVNIREEENKQLQVVGDVIDIKKVCDTSLVINRIAMECTLIILPHCFDNYNYDIILGSDFLLKHKIEVVVNPPRLTKYYDNNSFIDLYFDNQGEYKDKLVNNIKCVLRNGIHLEPFSMAQVEYRVTDFNPGDEKYLFSCNLIDPELKDKLSVIPGICNGDNKKVLLMSSDSSINIKAGQVLGSLSSIVELPDEEINDRNNFFNLSNVSEHIDVSHVSESSRHEIYKMILSHSNVLSSSENDIGNARVTEHSIKLYDETPIYHRPRRLAPPIAQEIEEQCQQLHMLDIIEPSNSPWSSPIVPIRKADGTVRMCIDYRSLNKQTIKDRFPIPCLTDSLYGLGGNKFFTSLDLIKGYYQVPIEPRSRPYTAFTTYKNHWQFKRLAFGLCNAPATFQREIQSVLCAFPSNKVIAYLDDILIMSKTFSEHLELLSKVLATLDKYCIKIKLSKCKWFASEIEYLGHIVSERGLRKTPKYIDKVVQFPKPTTVEELRQFLGFCNFQRKFVKDCSIIQKPLSCITGKNKKDKIVWTKEMDDAFCELKRRLSEEIELAYPIYSEEASPLEVWVDASGYGAGAMLCQLQEGEYRVVGYASMTFTNVQRSYSTLERELTALRWGIKTFKPFVWGVPFTLMTDHQPLVFLHNMKLVCSRIARTLQELSEYQFDIKYVPGEDNYMADRLSRMMLMPIDGATIDEELPPGLVLDGDAAPGGGNSLFFSLYKVLSRINVNNLPLNDRILREVVIDELLAHSERYNMSLDRNARKNFKLMRHPGQMPTMEILPVVSYLFKVKICVYFFNTQPVIYQYDEYDSVVSLQCLGGVHFNPLMGMKDYVLPKVHHSNMVSCTVPSSVPHADNNFTRCSDEEISVNIMVPTIVKSCNHRLGLQPQISMKIGGHVLCAVLDSGSQASLVSAEVVELIDGVVLFQPQPKFDICGFTGESIHVYKTIKISSEVNNYCLPPFEFAVVEKNVIPCCLLLGLDYLQCFSFKINFHSLSCTFGHDGFCQFGILADGYHCNMTTNTINCEKNKLALSVSNSDIRFELSGDTNTVSGLSLLFDDHDIKYLQSNDPVIRRLLSYIRRSVPVDKWHQSCKIFGRYSHELYVENGLLYYGAKKILTPRSILVDIAVLIHSSYAHVGRDKLLQLVSEVAWHPSKYSIVKDITSTCYSCQLTKISNLHVNPPILKICTSFPFEIVAIDLISLPLTKRGFIGCLTMVDHFSKFGMAIPIKNKTSSHIIDLLRGVLPWLPCLPVTILSDNGGEFRNVQFTDFLNEFGVKQQFTTPHSPSSNGLVERFNRTLQGLLRSLKSADGEWDNDLTRVLISYNNSIHSETGTSPSLFLLTKCHVISSLPLVSSNKLKERWFDGNDKFNSFKINDCVLLKIHLPGNLTTNKVYKDRYSGPFKVVRVNDNKVTYQLKDEKSSKIIRAHHRDIVIFRVPPGYLCNHPWFSKVDDINVNLDRDYDDNCDNGNNMSFMSLVQDISDDSDEETSSESDESSSVLEESSLKLGRTRDEAFARCHMCEMERYLELKYPSINNLPKESMGQREEAADLSRILTFAGDDVNQVWEFSSLSNSIKKGAVSSSDPVNSPDVPQYNIVSEEIKVIENLKQLEDFIDDSHERIFNDGTQYIAECDIDVIVNSTRNNVITVSTPIDSVPTRALRSQGPVPDLPNVQNKIIERKSRIL